VVTVHLGNGDSRFVHGIASNVRSWEEGSSEDRRRLRIRVVPRLWLLGKNRKSRIFQALSAVEIVEKVLKDGGVELKKSLSGSYAAREYCVQYGESDLAFVSRLLEEEGIFFFFEHEQGRHVMVLGDAPNACPDLPGGSRIVFREPTRMVAGDEAVFAFSQRLEVRPTEFTLRDYDWSRPALDLTASAGSGASLEVYEYPGGYRDGGPGKALAKVRLEEERARVSVSSGASRSRRLLPGHVFELAEHPVDGMNQRYLVVSVRHQGKQPEVLASGSGGHEEYRNDLVCIPATVPFRPARRTPRALVQGAQTAIVVGPAGEEIHTDEHGRIKVQFHWDREGKHDDHSSCWIRVSQAWAGPGWGALYLPRIGQEVVVGFLEGDPDQPIVTGAVYNGANPPPVALPGEKTRSTLRSASSPGSNGSNELRFEDAAGKEEIYLHAQKDLDIVVENDKAQKVGHDETLQVTHDRSRQVGHDQSLTVGHDETITVGGSQWLEVAANRMTKVGGAHSETVGGDQTVSVGAAQTVTVALAAVESVGLAKMLNVGGAYAVTVGAAMNEAVGGLKAEEVGGAKVEVVGAHKSETVAGSRTLDVGSNLTETVGGTRSLKVDGAASIAVGGALTQNVADVHKLKAKEIVFAAEDELVIKVGSAKIVLKKNGDVTIQGNNVEAKASGDITLKASKIVEN
jgi:type VI secretion system secreted protein VgrG